MKGYLETTCTLGQRGERVTIYYQVDYAGSKRVLEESHGKRVCKR